MNLEKALNLVLNEALEYADAFLKKSAAVLQEHTASINMPPIKKKTHIKTNLANEVIYSSKSPASAPILLGRKLDRSLQLCID